MTWLPWAETTWEGEEDSMSDYQKTSAILPRTSRLLQRSYSSICRDLSSADWPQKSELVSNEVRRRNVHIHYWRNIKSRWWCFQNCRNCVFWGQTLGGGCGVLDVLGCIPGLTRGLQTDHKPLKQGGSRIFWMGGPNVRGRKATEWRWIWWSTYKF